MLNTIKINAGFFLLMSLCLMLMDLTYSPAFAALTYPTTDNLETDPFASRWTAVTNANGAVDWSTVQSKSPTHSIHLKRNAGAGWNEAPHAYAILSSVPQTGLVEVSFDTYLTSYDGSNYTQFGHFGNELTQPADGYKIITLGYNGSGKLQVYDKGGWYSGQTAVTVPLNTWVHHRIVFDQDNLSYTYYVTLAGKNEMVFAFNRPTRGTKLGDATYNKFSSIPFAQGSEYYLDNFVLGRTVTTVTGGGTALQTAINAAGANAYIVINDSLTYTQSSTWNIGSSQSGITVVAAPNQNPQIDLSQATGISITDASALVNAQFGDLTGGRIKFRGTSASVTKHFLVTKLNGGEVKWYNLEFDGNSATPNNQAIEVDATAANTRYITINKCYLQYFANGANPGNGSIRINEAVGGTEGTATINTVSMDRVIMRVSKPAFIYAGLNSHGGTPGTFTLTNCRAEEIWASPGLCVFGKAVNATVDRCWFSDCNYGVMCGDRWYNLTPMRGGNLTMTNSAIQNFYDNGQGDRLQTYFDSAVTLNHCDIQTSVYWCPIDAGYTQQYFNGTIAVTNCNLLAKTGASMAANFTGGTHSNSYNNCPQGYTGGWVAGSNDKSIANPKYEDPKADMTVEHWDLKQTASDGNDIGSMLKRFGDEWVKANHDARQQGYQPNAKAQWTGAPAAGWTYDLGAWTGYLMTRWSNGSNGTTSLPYQSAVDPSYYTNNAYLYGIGAPLYDLDQNAGTPKVAVGDSPNVKIADILPGTAGLEKVVMEANAGSPSYCRLYRWDQPTSNWIQVWQSALSYTDSYGPVVCVADMNNDGQLDIVFSKHYEVVVLNGATGAQMMQLTAMPGQRNYGYLGVADINGDGYKDICVVSDFAEYVTVIRNNSGTSLTSLWLNQIEGAININQKAVVASPNCLSDVDGNGVPDVVVNVYNYDGTNNTWSAIAFNPVNGNINFRLDNCYFMGVGQVNSDAPPEIFMQQTSGQTVPTYGTPIICHAALGSGFFTTWTAPANSNFCTRSVDSLPLTVNTGAADGRRDVVLGWVEQGTYRDFFLVQPGVNQENEVVKCYGYAISGGAMTNFWSLTGPAASTLNVEASADIDLLGNGYETLISIRSRGESGESVTRANMTAEVKSWYRIANNGGTLSEPVVSDLDGDGRMEIIAYTANEEVVCLREDGPKRTIAWRKKGQPMTNTYPGSQLGVLVTDLEEYSYGKKEVIFAKEAADGRASLIALYADGTTFWQHSFANTFDGSKPVWNTPGITSWVADHFTTTNHRDIYVTLRRSKMHSDSGILISGMDGSEIWRRDSVTLDNGDTWGHGGSRIASADIDGDGLAEVVWCFPVDICAIKGTTGNPVFAKNTAFGLFGPYWIAYGNPAIGNMVPPNTYNDIIWGTTPEMVASVSHTGTVNWQSGFGANGATTLPALADGNWIRQLQVASLVNTAGSTYKFRIQQGYTGAYWVEYDLSAYGVGYSDTIAGNVTNSDIYPEYLVGHSTSISCVGHYAGLRWNLPIGTYYSQMTLADEDSDGYLDLLVTDLNGYLRRYQ